MLRKHWFAGLGVWFVLAAVAWAAPPYKALIVDGQNGHDWKGTTPVLKKLLEETGLFAVDVATSPAKGQDMSGFKPNFAEYNVVVSNYQGDVARGDAEGPGRLRARRRRAGDLPLRLRRLPEVEGVQRDDRAWAAGAAAPRRPARTSAGATARSSATRAPGKSGGHGPTQPFQIVVREPNHPITKGLPPTFMHVTDELYGWLRGPAKNLTVLATAFAPKDKGGADEHEPILFTVVVRQGPRVLQRPGPHGQGTQERGLHRHLPARRRMGRHRQSDAEGPRRFPHGRQGQRAGVGGVGGGGRSGARAPLPGCEASCEGGGDFAPLLAS